MLSLSNAPLNALRAVEAVARGGSLARAADELRISPSAVSQHLHRIERQLGRPLFERKKEGLTLTAFGAQFALKLSAGFQELRQALALADTQASNTIVVSVAPEFASRWLVPRLGRLYARHPEVILRFDTSAREVDFARSDVDLAIRFGAASWAWGEAELLFEQTLYPVCAPEIAARLHGSRALAGEWSIDDGAGGVRWPDWFRAGGEEPVDLRPGASFSDAGLCVEAAIAGQGVLLGWPLLVSGAVAKGRLKAPFALRPRAKAGYFVIAPRGVRLKLSALTFRRWLTQEAERETIQTPEE